jgi:hypothetical protein
MAKWNLYYQFCLRKISYYSVRLSRSVREESGRVIGYPIRLKSLSRDDGIEIQLVGSPPLSVLSSRDILQQLDGDSVGLVMKLWNVLVEGGDHEWNTGLNGFPAELRRELSGCEIKEMNEVEVRRILCTRDIHGYIDSSGLEPLAQSLEHDRISTAMNEGIGAILQEHPHRGR